MTACTTADHGSSTRGNALLRISRPPETTELRASAHRVGHQVVGEDARHEVGEEPRAARSAAQDVDEDEVDAREHQRVEHQPQLPEHRVEVLRAQPRARQLERERAPSPRFPDVREQRRQPDEVRLVDVMHLGEVVLAVVRVVRGGGHGVSRCYMMGGRPARVIRASVRPRSRRPCAARSAQPVPVPSRRGLQRPPGPQAGRRPQGEGRHVEDAQRQRQVAAREPDTVAGADR